MAENALKLTVGMDSDDEVNLEELLKNIDDEAAFNEVARQYREKYYHDTVNLIEARVQLQFAQMLYNLVKEHPDHEMQTPFMIGMFLKQPPK